MFTRSRPEPARFDPFLNDEGLRRPYQLLFSAEWEELDHVFTTDPQAWIAASILVSNEAVIETTVFEHYVEGRPSVFSLSLLGAALLRDHVPPGDPSTWSLTPTQREQLAHAEHHLFEAIRHDHLIPDPWIHLLTSGRALRVSLIELRERFENANSRAPFRADACRAYLLGLSGRGGATDKTMFDFVRWLFGTAPPGSPTTITLPMAHLEHGFGTQSQTGLDDHLRQPATISDVTESLADYLRHAPVPVGPAELATLNAYAYAVVVTDHASAVLVQDCYARIDNRPTAYPWSKLAGPDGDLPALFCAHQRAQLETASRFAPQ